jgi:hypothetical protein
MRSRVCAAMAVGLALSACAGRDPMPIATVQAQDAVSDCAMITAEIEANNIKFKELADEQGLKTGQNIAAGVAGIVIWPLWFAMDFKGAASKDVVALQSRQQYLTSLATQRCHQTPPPPVAVAPPFAPPHRATAVKPKPQSKTQPSQVQATPPQAQPTPPPSQN